MSAKTAASLAVFAAVACLVQPAAASCPAPDPAMESRIETLLTRMSLPEKIAQMRIFHSNADARILGGQTAITLGPDGQLIMPPEVESRFANGIAGIKNPGEKFDPESAARLTNALQAKIMAASPNRIPALFVAEAYNGLDATGTTKFARPIAMASTWNPDLVGRAWDVIGREARMRGFHMIHSPVADMHRDPRFGRMSEGYGEDSFLTSAMVIAAVRAVQGNQTGLKSTHIGAVTKHFVGYGQVDGGRNFASVNINPRDLIDQYFPPFKAAVEQGCTLGIMPSHGDINGVASHGNRWLLTDTLKKQWGFDGYVVSDAEDVARLGFFMGVAKDDRAAALAGLNAGVDIDLYSERAYFHLAELAANNPALVPAIDDAVRRVLRTKMKLGLFEKPLVDSVAAASGTRTKAALDLALAVDLEAAILLKNDGNLLPLAANFERTIALIGPLIKAETAQQFSSIFGSKTRFIAEPGLKLTNGEEGNPELISAEANKPGFQRALAAARSADLAILFVGDDEFTAKEAYFRDGIEGDRANIDLAGQQDDLVRAIKALGKPVIVVLKNRRTLSIAPMSQNADAILDVWEPGERGDEAIAMLLSGRASPSGRLPVSIPRSVGHLPIHYSQKRINFKKGYLFEEDGPLYPFGHGLTYTSFDYGPVKLSSPVMPADKTLTASVLVHNKGTRSGQEVVQMYLSDPVATVTRPLKELKAFQKIDLAAGASREVRFVITPDMLAHTGADMNLDPGYGDFIIEIAPSSAGGGGSAQAEYRQP